MSRPFFVHGDHLETSTASAVANVFFFPALANASPLPICHGGHRAERHLTCIVDGDMGWENDLKSRCEAIDAPEMPAHASCKGEGQRAIQARDRLRELMAGGYTVSWSGDKGRYGRQLVTITLADGRDAGRVLMSEHLAQKWPNRGNVWCSR